MNSLRNYQNDLYVAARNAIAQHRAIMIQLHTGGGKTVIFTAMVSSVFQKNKKAWIIVPRKQLAIQASNHLKKWNVPHGIIDANNIESRAYQVHICSKATLERRWNKIKNWPHLIIIDEAHVNYDFQKALLMHAPEYTKIIGYSATPQRLDSRGLSNESGGIYDILIEGPSIPWLTERGFLVPIRYFSPPLEGLDKIKTNKFGEYDEETLEELLQRRKVYGDMVSHWERWGRDRSTLIFCRSVKSAKHAAERFRDKGYNFVAIDGSMPDKKINDIIDKHRSGEIQGICNCLLVSYGVDIERIEYIGDISPTESLSSYCQKIGRGLRPFTDPITGYVKRDLIYMDHVNQILNHQDPAYPGVPLHYVPKINWNFHGTEKRKRDKSIKNVVLCPHLDFMYCEAPHCQTCSHNPDKKITDCRRPMVIVPAQLQEIKPVPMQERPPEERREIQDQIGALVLEYRKNMLPGPVGELLKIAEALGRDVLWVYHMLTEDGRHTINIPLLAEIARQKGYRPGWVWIQKNKMRGKRSA